MGSPLKQASFVGGEVTPSLHARVDIASYRTWLKTLRNFIVRPQGGVRNRPGTQFVAEVAAASAVIPTTPDIVELVPDIWLDSQESLTHLADGANVNTWTGLDANVRSFADTGGAGAPIYSTTASGFDINGFGAVNYNVTSINSTMTIVGGTNRTYIGAYTVAIVYRSPGVGAAAPFHAFGRNPVVVGNEGMTLPGAQAVTVFYAGTSYAMTGVVTPTPGSSHYIVIRRDASNVHRVWFDGVEITPGSPLTQAGTLTVGGLFCLDDGSFADTTCSLGTFLVFPSSLAEDDIDGLNRYLSLRWAFTVVPPIEVSGIRGDEGRVSLVPFIFNRDEAYVLVFGNGYVRFIRNGALVHTVASDATIASYDATGNPAIAIVNATNPWRSQSFVSVQSDAIDIAEVRAWIYRDTGTVPDVQVAIYTNSAGLPGTAVAGLDFTDFSTLSAASIGTSPAEQTFTKINPAAPVALAVGTIYHLVFKTVFSGHTGQIFMAATNVNGYPSGESSRSTNGTAWVAQSGVDLWFTVVGDVPVGAPVEVATTYTADEAREIKGRTAQSADVMFIPHHNHNPAELRRNSETSWALQDLVNGPTIPAPAAPTITGDTTGLGGVYNPLKEWWYVVTAIDAATGQQSYGSIPEQIDLNVSGPWPATVTLPTAVDNASGYNVYRGRNYGIYGYVGSTSSLEFFDDGQAPDYSQSPIADPSYEPTPAPTTPTPDTPIVHAWTMHPGQGTWWWAITAVISGVESFASQAVPVVGFAFTPPFLVTVEIPEAVPGATSYNIYRGESEHVLGLIGSTASLTFNDLGTAPNYASPPLLRIAYQIPGAPPITFDADGDYPSVACFMDQRLIFAGTDNAPDSIFGSRLGDYRNFSASVPAGDDDAFEFTLAALTVDRILGLIHSRALMAFTAASEYVIKGNRDSAIGPSSIDAKSHAYYGSSEIAPLAVGGRILFSQREGQSVREFRYDFQQDGYTAEDERSVLAKHLLDGHTIVDWAYAKGPDSIVWMVRDDGILLGMTYLPQHEVIAWHRHDTDGLVESVACIPEGNETAVYIAVTRAVEGETKRFIERFASREIEDVADSVFLDCSLTYHSPDMSSRILTLSGASGWTVGSTATATITGATYFVAAHVGSQLIVNDAAGAEYRLTITARTSGFVVTVRFERDIPTALQAPTMAFTHALKVFQFPHMIGETVSALVDGNVVADLVVDASGDVTLPFAGATVTIGKPYTSELETLDINVDGRNLQTVKKINGQVWFDVVMSRGLWVGEDTASMKEWKQRRVADGSPNAGAATPLATIRDYVTITGGWNHNGRVIVQQRDPLPLELTAITPLVTFGG